MCFGTRLYDGNPCPYEIKSGWNAGECGKPYGKECPDNDEQEEDHEI